MEDIMEELFGGNKDFTNASPSKLSIQERCRHDLALFAKTYLPHVFPSEFCSFHEDMMGLLNSVIYETPDEETDDVIACPRGHAKSTLASFLFPIYNCCYGTKKFTLLISATSNVAKQFIVDIKNELEFNEKLVKDFNLKKDGTMWNATDFRVTSRYGTTYVCGRGAGAQVRGLKANGGTRPDLIIVDDLEEEEDVTSPTRAEQLEKWFNSDLLPCGAAGHTSFIVVGTVLAYNSLLYKLLNEPRYSMWRRRTYSAVMKFSSDDKDWEEWERLMLNTEDKNAALTAKEYYEEHKEDMLSDVEVLWEKQRKDMYLYLMCRKLADEGSFNSEFQNQPLDEKSRTFKSEWLESNTYNESELPELKNISLSIDPSLGKKRSGDTSAIIGIGQGKNDGKFYIIEASIEVRKPDALIKDAEDIIKKYYRFDPLVTIETNAFQNFFATTIKERFEKDGIYIRWNEIIHSTGDSKVQRINSLVPYIKNGVIKFPSKGARRLKEQLKMYPKGHDDAPDALEMALRPLLNINKSSFSFGSYGSNSESKKEDFSFLGTLQRFLNEKQKGR